MCRISCKHAAKRRIFGFRTVLRLAAAAGPDVKRKGALTHEKLLGIVLSAAMLLSRPPAAALLHPVRQQILPLTLPLLPMQLPAT